MAYENLDPVFQVPQHKTRIVVPFEIEHAKSHTVTAHGEAIFENGKAIVLTPMTWLGIAGEIHSTGTLDHLFGWLAMNNEEYIFHWNTYDNIRIE